MSTEATLSWESSIGMNDAVSLVVVAIHAGVDIPEVLRKMVFSEARLHLLDTLIFAQATDPRFGRVALK